MLAFLVARALDILSPLQPRRAALASIVLSTLFGLSDEIHQYFVPGRDASALDLLADFLGSAAGAAAYLAWRRLLLRFSRPAVGQ